MRKWMVIVVVGMVVAIAACGPGAEPTPTPTSTPVVATPTPTPTPGMVATPTATPRPVVATATPTATPRPVVATPTPTAAPLATPTATATPKRGGILKLRSSAAAGTFYVHQVTGGDEYVAPMYNTLVAQDPLDPASEKLVPDLADRWEISGDGLTITFFLHQGVKFSDGVSLTSADVKYNYDLVRNPPTGFPSPRKSLFDPVASIETPNDYTVVLKLKQVSNTMVPALATCYMAIMPKHLMEKDVLHAMDHIMVGTGPYQFKNLTPEGILVVERNPSYWKPGLPYLDGIRVIPISDLNAFMAALYTGQIDTASSSASARVLGKTEVQRIRKEHPELLVQGSVAGATMQWFGLNTKIPPFTDQRVRQAVQDAIDRQNLLDTSASLGVVGGMKPPVSYWALPAEELAKLPGYGPDIKARRERSRQLLKDAGVATGTEIKLSTDSVRPLNVDAMELAQLQLQEALPSLKFNIRNYAGAEFDKLEESFSLQTAYAGRNAGTWDPDYFGPLYTTTGGRNTMSVSVPRIDELHAKQTTMLDPAQRRLVVWELDKLVIQNAAFVPLFWRIDPCPAWPYVKNQVCAKDGHGSGSRYEIVWLDK